MGSIQPILTLGKHPNLRSRGKPSIKTHKTLKTCNYTECSTNHVYAELNGVFWELYHRSNKGAWQFSSVQYPRSANCGA